LHHADELVLFNRLSRENMDGILNVRLAEVRLSYDISFFHALISPLCPQLMTRLEDRKIKLDLGPEARTWLCDRGYEPAYGARPLNRIISRYVMNPLAKGLLEGYAMPMFLNFSQMVCSAAGWSAMAKRCSSPFTMANSAWWPTMRRHPNCHPKITNSEASNSLLAV
jgi:hypothetical protein